MPLDAPLYPVGLVVADRPCLVVGGGHIAERKVDGLLGCGASVTVIAPTIVESLRARHHDGVHLVERPYATGDALSFRLVIAATDQPLVNAAIYAECEAAGIWCNAADQPTSCSFTLPAIARRGPVTIAVATGGTSPALAGVLRDRLAAALPEHLDAVVAELARRRAEMQADGTSTEAVDWRPLITRLLDDPAAVGS